MDLDLNALKNAFGFGVAGNFAGHLEQAGEASDFVNVQPTSAEAPKGIFPWYVPGAETDLSSETRFLGTFPLSSQQIKLPEQEGPLNLQIEPEVGVIATAFYGEEGSVTSIKPTAIGAFNDCSIRREGATKISQKKNWGADSKGVAAHLLPVTDIDPAGQTREFRLASFLRRGQEVHAYGIDSPLPGYSYYGTQLLEWIVDRLNNQAGSPETPLEPVGQYLRAAGNPETLLIGIGATRYTEFGESNFLQAGDESIVVVYDSTKTSPESVAELVQNGQEHEISSASVLVQRVS